MTPEEKSQAIRYIAGAQVAGGGASAVTDATRTFGSTAFIHVDTVSTLLDEQLVDVESYDTRWDVVTLTPAGWSAHLAALAASGMALPLTVDPKPQVPA